MAWDDPAVAARWQAYTDKVAASKVPGPVGLPDVMSPTPRQLPSGGGWAAPKPQAPVKSTKPSFWGAIGEIANSTANGGTEAPRASFEADKTTAALQGLQEKRKAKWDVVSQGDQQLSNDEFAGLSDRQRSLVNAQSSLQSAIAEDRKDRSAMTDTDQYASTKEGVYADAVSKLFGDKGGSDYYAPRTVAILSSLGLDTKAGDLDQYLDGTAFLDKKELSSFKDTAPTNSNVKQQSAFSLSESAQRADIAPLLQKGQSILSGLTTDGSLSFAEKFVPAPVAGPLDNLSTEQITQLRSLMTGMALNDQPADLGNYYDSVQADYGLNPDTIETFLRNEMTNWEAGTTSFGDGYNSPAQFRARWDLN